MTQQTMTISNVHSRGFGFAVTHGTGEQVFIPPHTLDGHDLRAGDKVEGILVINASDRSAHGTPWMCVRIESDKEQAKEKTDEQTMQERDAEVYDVIAESVYVTTSEIAEFLEVDTKTALNSAMRLYNAGRVAKADVYAKVGQARPSFVLWSADAKRFLEDV